MAYTDLADARSKVINPREEHNSIILYASNAAFDLTTVFYTDVALTTLASAGKYWVATNFTSYFIELNASGMLVSLPVVGISAGTDTSWVEDRLYSGDTKVSNQWIVGGTEMVLFGYILTDFVWASRPYTNSKRWAANNGPINSTPLVDINLSDMKGFDIIFYTGEWDGTKFVSYNFTYGFVHIADDGTRTIETSNKKYYFKPDYWIPKNDFDSVSFFRRMPNVNKLKGKNGTHEKYFSDMSYPYHDIVKPDSGRTSRTSTILNKGITMRRQFFKSPTGGGQPYRKVYQDFLDSPQTEYITDNNPNIKLNFNDDQPFKQGIAYSYGVTAGDVTVSPTWDARIVAHMESLIVDDATWASGTASNGIPYATANPYHWKCRGIAADWASGTNYDQSMMGGAGLQAFYYFDNPPTLYAPQNAIHVQWDFEYLPSAQTNEICGQVFKNMVLVCEGKIWGPNVAPFFGIDQGALGAVKPKYSIYGGGIYNRAAEGSGTSGWGYITAGNYAVSDLYSDYHNYYTNGTISYATMTGYRAFYKGAIDVLGYMFVTNYQNKINENWYFYNLVHSYDITRKIIGEIGTANATDYSSIRVCSYFWRYFEPVSSGTDVAFCRQAFDYGGILRGDRPEVSPAMLQSLAVWSFAYADGMFLWDDSIMGEERQRLIDDSTTYGLNLLTDDRIFTQYVGDTLMIGKGAHDWTYVGYWQCVQNKDIIEANTDWLVPDYYKTGAGAYTTGTENYPVSLCGNQIPLCRYKLNAAGTEALVIITSPFNNGYTKETHTLRLPAKSNYSFTVDTFGTYTTVLRLTGL